MWHLLQDGEQIPVSSDMITLKFLQGTNQSQISTFENQYDLNFRQMAETGWYDYSFSTAGNLMVRCNAIQNEAIVELVEISSRIDLLMIPNDSAVITDPFGQVWNQYSIPNSRVEKAWDKTTGDPSVVIAFLDTGVDWWHEDFAQGTGTLGNMWVNSGEDA